MSDKNFKGNFNQQVLRTLYGEINKLIAMVENNKQAYANIAVSHEPAGEHSDEWFDGFRTACCEIAALIRAKQH